MKVPCWFLVRETDAGAHETAIELQLMFMFFVAVPEAPSLSVAWAVTVWIPSE
jgi:hypothetical protein